MSGAPSRAFLFRMDSRSLDCAAFAGGGRGSARDDNQRKGCAERGAEAPLYPTDKLETSNLETWKLETGNLETRNWKPGNSKLLLLRSRRAAG